MPQLARHERWGGVPNSAMTTEVTETFFLPREIERLDWSVPPDIYNLYRSLLIRNEKRPVFVPIRSMQFMAVLDRDEILFIVSQS